MVTIMKFLKRLYACLKHYPLPKVVVFGRQCELTGLFHYDPRVDDIKFEVAFHNGPQRHTDFISADSIHEIQTCH